LRNMTLIKKQGAVIEPIQNWEVWNKGKLIGQKWAYPKCCVIQTFR